MNDVFNILIKNKLSPNTFYILFCISENIVPNNGVSLELEKTRLTSAGWLDDDGKLSDKSKELIGEINSFFKVRKKKTSASLMGDNFSEKIEDYLDIFPKFKLPSGLYARSNKRNLENNFRWFFQNYDYDWTLIIKATKKYVAEYELKNYMYMRTSQYFIRKQNTDKSYDSELANYCDVIINGDQEHNTDNGHFKEDVV